MLLQNKDNKKVASKNLFPVIGVGASAGGLEAFKQLLKNIPEDSGMAYILVQHLDPVHESILPEILQRVTNIPVLEISDNISVLPDHIYIIPANKILIANDGVLRLGARPPKPERNRAIDIFFESLAEIHRHYAIGIVLSGTGSDGTIGLGAIKDMGGITFAQQPDSASYNSMPLNAIQSGIVDIVLTPAKIPGKLLELYQKRKLGVNNENPETGISEKDYSQILTLLKEHSGIDFTNYKQNIIRKIILRRLVRKKIEAPKEYLHYLQHNQPEQNRLYQELLARETSFFRDRQTFDNLCETVFPAMVKNKTLTDPLRIWIAGCSTGEEAYSLAICLSEYVGVNDKNIKIMLFATDISEKVIAKARTGIYTKSELASVSESRKHQFFDKINGSYQVKKKVRNMCIFASHNFLKDPPFARIDLVICRNALMYMEPVLQNKALSAFHYALNEGALLQLGKSESIGSATKLFAIRSKHFKLYTSTENRPRSIDVKSRRSEKKPLPVFAEVSGYETEPEDFRKIADDILLTSYTPVGVVVDEFFDIVQFRGATGAYLEQPPGKPCLNVIKMAREYLAFELRVLLHKAKILREPVIKENIFVDGGRSPLTIEVIPLLNTFEPHFLVLFKQKNENKRSTHRSPDFEKNDNKNSAEYLRIQYLENELAYSKDDMRRIVEEQDIANDDLQSANEELLSGSEELQTLNEDLETSKEQIQNTLEELIIVNRELVERNEQYNNERKYSEAIVKTMRQPLLILTKDLRIKGSNNAFYKTFKVSAQETEGRFLYELGARQWNIPALNNKIKDILNDKSFEDFEVSQTFPEIGERTMMLNATQLFKEDSTEQLILLAIEDITERKLLDIKEKAFAGILLNERRVLHDFIMQTPACLCILKGPKHIFELANPFYIELIGKRDLLGKPMEVAVPEFKKQGIIKILNEVYKTGKSFIGKEIPVRIDGSNGILQELFLNLNYKPLINKNGLAEGILVFAYDVTEQINSRKKIESNASLLQNLYMNAPAFICALTGPEYIYELVNPAYHQLFDNRKLLGRPILEALPELKEQGYKKILDTVYDTSVTWIGKEFPIYLARQENAQVELRYFNLSNQPMFDDEGNIKGILTFGYEVTEEIRGRKILAEIAAERIAVLETIPQCAWTANSNGDITYVNKFFLEYTGIIEAEAKIWGWTKVVDPNNAEITYKKYKQLIKLGKNFELEFLMRRNSDDTFRWHLLRALAIQQQSETAISWVGTSTDIHDQMLFAEVLEKQVAERTKALKISNIELEHSNKNLQQFAYVASHDLQEPLRKIQVFSSMLTENFPAIPGKMKDLLHKINNSSQRMSVLIKDLLNFSKSTQLEFAYVETDLNQVLDNILSEFDLMISQKKAVIHRMHLPVIEAIPLQMTQLFYNLVSNALKFYSTEREPVIELSFKMLSAEEISLRPKLHKGASYYEFIFKDNGIGFNQQFAEKVFLIFQRLNGRNLYPGTGIGLALCQNIVNNHKGEIYAEGIEDIGATFYILLPLKQSTAR